MSKGFSRRAALAAICALTIGFATTTVPAATDARAAHRGDAAAARSAVASVTGKDHNVSVPARTLDQMIRRAFEKAQGRFDGQVLAEVARMQLGSALGRTIPSPYDHRAAAAGGVPEDVYTDRYQFDAGDLTGDGLNDIVNIDFTYGFNWETGEFRVIANEVMAFRGVDGNVLWTRDYAPSELALPVGYGDFDGDGRRDVLVLSLNDDGTTGVPCAVVVCAGQVEIRYHWALEAVSMTGAIQWSKRYDVSGTVTVVAAGALVAGALAEVVEIANFGIRAAVSDDHSADGRTDLVVTTIDLRAQLVIADSILAFAYSDSYSFTVRGEILSGEDGSALLSRTAENSDGAYLLPVGDAIGSSTGDVAWVRGEIVSSPLACVYVLTFACVGPRRTILHVEMIDGFTRAGAWTVTRDDPLLESGFVDPMGTDLNGDNKADLLLGEWDQQGFFQGILSGASGALLWRSQTDAYLFPAGSLGGTPGGDLLSVTFEWTEGEFWSALVTATRIDGGSGAVISQTQHEYTDDQDTWFDLYVFLAGDTDEDGIQDLSFTEIRVPWDDGTEHSDSVVESGRTGGVVFHRAVDGRSILVPAGDTNGDAADDAFDLSFSINGVATFVMREMPSGAVTWTLTEPNIIWDLIIVGDLFGTGGDDFALSLYDNNFDKSRFDAVDARAGARVWGHGDPLLPPVGTLGSIEGVVSGPSGPLGDVCVEAASEEDDFFVTYTRPDGTYHLNVVANTYRVRFDDCGDRGYQTEWWDDKPNYQTANPVTVVVGVVVDGINAVLSPPPPPGNDAMAAAAVFDLIPYEDYRNTASATLEANEPSECGVGRSVWYRYTPIVPSITAFRVFAYTNFDPAIGVYRGSDPTALENIGCHAGNEGEASQVVVTLPGETYWIQAGGNGDAGGEMAFTATPSV